MSTAAPAPGPGRWDTVRAAVRGSTRTTQVGLALFVLGLVFLAADVLPFFGGDHNTPLWLNLLCLLAPLGVAVLLVSLVRRGQRDQRAALAALEQPEDRARHPGDPVLSPPRGTMDGPAPQTRGTSRDG